MYLQAHRELQQAQACSQPQERREKERMRARPRSAGNVRSPLPHLDVEEGLHRPEQQRRPRPRTARLEACSKCLDSPGVTAGCTGSAGLAAEQISPLHVINQQSVDGDDWLRLLELEVWRSSLFVESTCTTS